jgi:hypothetical protein
MYWDADGLAAYIVFARGRDKNGDFIYEWVDLLIDARRDSQGNIVRFMINDQGFTNGRKLSGLKDRGRAIDFFMADSSSVLKDPTPKNTPLNKLLQDDIVVFAHGYNVDTSSAKLNWTAEMYKRLVDAGYEGDLVVVSWLGNEPLFGKNKKAGKSGSALDINYFERNVENANNAGRTFAEILDEIRTAKPNAKINTAAHSLGNRTMLSGLQFAMDANMNLCIHNVLHAEAAVDGNVYYQKQKLLHIEGEFSEVPKYVDDIYNFTSRKDQVLRLAYGSNRNIRRGYFIWPIQPWRRAALGLKSPKNKNRLPKNFHSIPTQNMGIIGHSAMIEEDYYDVLLFFQAFYQALQ